MSETVQLLDYTIQNDSVDNSLSAVKRLQKKAGFHRIVTLNPQMIVGGENNLLLKQWLQAADIILADGVGLKWAAKLLLKQELSIVTGVQLVQQLIEENAYSFYFVGAGDTQLKAAVDVCKRCCPGSTIVGSHHGFFSQHDSQTIIEDIVAKKPDFIFVGLGFPKQEYFIQTLSKYANSGIAVGVGGVFDVLSGHKRLAPAAIRNIGFEWLFRGLQEPKRIRHWSFLFRYIALIFQNYFGSVAKYSI